VQQMMRRFSSTAVSVFDRQLKRRQREFALQLSTSYYEYLREESNGNIVDRLDDINKSFPIALELGSYRGDMYRRISSESQNHKYHSNGGLVGGILELIQTDIAEFALKGSRVDGSDSNTDDRKIINDTNHPAVKTSKLSFDEEGVFPFEDRSFDLVLSSLSLHWINDLPSALLQIKRVLKPDGAFIGSMFGGNTLKELRHCFYLAELERRGGFSPHASPLAKSSDIAGLMQDAGFNLPTIDIDTITVSYPDAISLMEHLVCMGEGSASINRQFAVGRDTFLSMASIYQQLYGLDDGSVRATFEIIYIIGWRPDASQPKACQRGSAKQSMRDALGNEQPT